MPNTNLLIDGLTIRERAFANAYVANNGNGKAAAIEAGYSKKGAAAVSSRLLSIPEVAAEVKRISKEKMDLLGITAEHILSELYNNHIMAKDAGKYADSNRALELLGKNQKLFVDKVESENTIHAEAKVVIVPAKEAVGKK